MTQPNHGMQATAARERSGCNQQPSLCLRCHSNVLGNRPQKDTQFPGNGNHDLMGLFAFDHQVAIPVAEPNLGLPADGLDRCGERCQAQLEMTPDCGRIPVGPGPFAQGTTGMGMASLGKTALLTPCPTGIFRGREPEIMHELSGGIEARQVAQFGHRDHRHRELDPAQGLEGLDHGSVHLLGECECQTAQTGSLFSDGLAVFLTDNVLRGGGPPTSLSQRRWAGLQVARPGERIACRSKKAVSRNVAAFRACRVSARARLRSRLAASSTAGT
jgi:hypothetical protein